MIRKKKTLCFHPWFYHVARVLSHIHLKCFLIFSHEKKARAIESRSNLRAG